MVEPWCKHCSCCSWHVKWQGHTEEGFQGFRKPLFFCEWILAKIGLASTRSKYSNRTVTYCNRTIMVYLFLKLQLAAPFDMKWYSEIATLKYYLRAHKSNWGLCPQAPKLPCKILPCRLHHPSWPLHSLACSTPRLHSQWQLFNVGSKIQTCY